MKIAVVTNIITPYRKRFYDEMFEQLTAQGDDFKVFSMTDSLPLRPWIFQDLRSPYMTLLPGYKFIFKMQDMDILVNPKVNKYLNEYSPDIIIVAGSWTYPTTMQMLFHKLKNKPKYLFWTESHEHRAGNTEVRSKGLLKKLKQKLYFKFDGFCVPGKYANDSVDSIVGTHGIRLRLPNLVDNGYYMVANELREHKPELRDKYGLPLNKTIFITPSRLIPRKGIDLFLSHLYGMPENERSVFILAGEGSLEQRIRDISEENNLDVRFMGYCNQDTIRELYAASDIFLLPSLSDPNPLTVIEAAFAGLPLCVAKYTGNNPELCRNNENGIVFETDNPVSVRETYKEVMSKSEDWLNQAGNLSLQIANENFDCNNEVHKFISQLRSL